MAIWLSILEKASNAAPAVMAIWVVGMFATVLVVKPIQMLSGPKLRHSIESTWAPNIAIVALVTFSMMAAFGVANVSIDSALMVLAPFQMTGLRGVELEPVTPLYLARRAVTGGFESAVAGSILLGWAIFIPWAVGVVASLLTWVLTVRRDSPRSAVIALLSEAAFQHLAPPLIAWPILSMVLSMLLNDFWYDEPCLVLMYVPVMLIFATPLSWSVSGWSRGAILSWQTVPSQQTDPLGRPCSPLPVT